MVSRRRKPPKLMGNHQQCWLWGRHVLAEILAAGRWKPLEIRVADDFDDAELSERICIAQVPLKTESRPALTALCGTGEHQGIAAKMPPFPYASAEEILTETRPRQVAAIAILDRIQDPFNFGAILRSAEVLGIAGVVIGSAQQADVNRQVVRSSAGAVNHLPIGQVPDLAEFARLASEDFDLVAATEKSETSLAEHDFALKTAFVIGNEGGGISAELLGVCDQQICIPQHGRIGSLNAAVAAGVMFHEFVRKHS